MDLEHLLALMCYYGPTPLAAILAGFQAAQCKSPWHALIVGAVGTVALSVVFGVAADYMPLWRAEFVFSRIWQIHLMFSPIVAIPVGLYCAYWVHQRNLATDRMD